jgi:hypothetical protein
MNLQELELSDPTRKALEEAGVETLEDAFRHIKGIGQARAEEVASALLASLQAEKPEKEPGPPVASLEVEHGGKVVTVQWLLDQLTWHEQKRAGA